MSQFVLLIPLLLFPVDHGPSASPQDVTKPSLAGFRYVILAVAANYENEPVDYYDVLPILEQKFKAFGWTVLSDAASLGEGRARPSETLRCSFTYGGYHEPVVLSCTDMLDRETFRTEVSGRGVRTGSQVRDGAIAAVAKLRADRLAFDPAAVVSILDRLPKRERVTTSAEEFEKYLATKDRGLDLVEGIWSTADRTHRLAVMRDRGSRIRQYVAFVIEAKSPLWRPGDVRAYLVPSSEATFTVRLFDVLQRETTTEATLAGDTLSIKTMGSGGRPDTLHLLKEVIGR